MTTEKIDLATWKYIRDIFLRAGFHPEEATWAANNNLNPRGPKRSQIMKLLRNRANKVSTLMRYSGLSRREVIEYCRDMRVEEARKKGGDEENVFVGESP